METGEKVQFEVSYTKYLDWKTSQFGQTDGFEYERSFAEFCKKFNKGLFELGTRN